MIKQPARAVKESLACRIKKSLPKKKVGFPKPARKPSC
jgi:hypothetical protein